MYKLGLTGSIATGKTTALGFFAQLGAAVFSADEAVHAAYGAEARAPVEGLFPGVVRDGVVDRAELARRIVAHPRALADLESIVHPLVRQRQRDFLRQAEADGAGLAVIDVPLLFETGFDYGVDGVAVTWCPPDEQRRRALARPGMTVEKLDTILARQLPQEEKRRRADFVIDTGVSLDETRAQVAAIVAQCLDQQRSRKA